MVPCTERHRAQQSSHVQFRGDGWTPCRCTGGRPAPGRGTGLGRHEAHPRTDGRRGIDISGNTSVILEVEMPCSNLNCIMMHVQVLWMLFAIRRGSNELHVAHRMMIGYCPAVHAQSGYVHMYKYVLVSPLGCPISSELTIVHDSRHANS